MGTCKLCGNKRPLVRAHVIPDSFYAPILDSMGYGLKVPAKTSEYESKMVTGEYDSNLVCEDCERRFSNGDSYAKQFLLDRDWSPDPAETDPCVRVKTFDYPVLKMFFISIAWRIGASDRPLFSRVSLGPHLQRLAKMILDNDPGGMDDYSVILAKFRGPHPDHPELDPRRGWMNPFVRRMEGPWCLQVYLADFIAVIKTDQARFPEKFRAFCLAPDRPLVVLLRDFQRSGELRAMFETIAGRERGSSTRR